MTPFINVGMFILKGPLATDTECTMGLPCTVKYNGVGLDIGNEIFFTIGRAC